jgi:hypothetical protein
MNTRVGPICRTVEDAARILDVIAGYDPKDELTAFAVGRMPEHGYASFARTRPARRPAHRRAARVHGHDALQQTGDEESVRLVEARSRAPEARRHDRGPGPGGALFTPCVRRYLPTEQNRLFTQPLQGALPRRRGGASRRAITSRRCSSSARLRRRCPRRSRSTTWAGAARPARARTGWTATCASAATPRCRRPRRRPRRRASSRTRTSPGGGGGAAATPIATASRPHGAHAVTASRVQQVILQCMAEQNWTRSSTPAPTCPR